MSFSLKRRKSFRVFWCLKNILKVWNLLMRFENQWWVQDKSRKSRIFSFTKRLREISCRQDWFTIVLLRILFYFIFRVLTLETCQQLKKEQDDQIPGMKSFSARQFQFVIFSRFFQSFRILLENHLTLKTRINWSCGCEISKEFHSVFILLLLRLSFLVIQTDVVILLICGPETLFSWNFMIFKARKWRCYLLLYFARSWAYVWTCTFFQGRVKSAQRGILQIYIFRHDTKIEEASYILNLKIKRYWTSSH